MGDQRNEIAKMIVDAIRKVENAIYRLSTYSNYINFGGASAVNSAGVAGLLGILGETTALISSVAEAANSAGALELEAELNGLAAIIADVSGGFDLLSEIVSSITTVSGIANGNLDSQQNLISSITEASDISCIRLNTVRLGGSCVVATANTCVFDTQPELKGSSDSELYSVTGYLWNN